MFVDVRGFTTLSEKSPPATVVAKLNRFYRLVARAVFELDGTFDKVVGDQVMAFLVRLSARKTTPTGRSGRRWKSSPAPKTPATV